VRAFRRTFGESVPTADSVSGGFVRQIPPLPVTPAVGPSLFGSVFGFCLFMGRFRAFSAKAFSVSAHFSIWHGRLFRH